MDEHRNSSVENYLEAINYIHSLGGVVIRLGDPVFLGYEDAYIDYPNTSFKSELMDLFLIKNCRFFWGTNSGIFDTALLFGVPTLAVNVSDFLFIRPYKSADRIIYKPILSREEGKIMSFEEVFRHTDSIMMSNIGLSGFEAFDKDYKMVENTSDEIRQVIEEMCVGFENDLPETYFQQAFKAQLNIAAIRWATQKFSDRHLNNAYRIAAKTYFSGRIGRHFAEKYLYGTPDLPHDKERCYEAEQ